MEAGAHHQVLVVDEAGRLVGALNSNDLMRAKVIYASHPELPARAAAARPGRRASA
jgi:CBS-domain-containing membrane protein